VVQVASDSSRWILVIAISAIGMKTSPAELKTIGWTPLAMLLAETIFLLAIVCLMLYWMN
jgi:uncharacterized membrane protein YadS